MRDIRKRQLFFGIAVIILTFCLGLAYVCSQDARSASNLLRITNGLALGRTTKDEFLSLSSPYRKYLLSNTSEDVMTFRIHGHSGKHVVMAVSVMFSGNVVVGRDVGILKEECCSVETRQRLDAPLNNSFGNDQVEREIVGDPQFVKLEVAPNVSGKALRHIFDYKTECLLPFERCNSIERLNPQSLALLHGSAGT